MIVTLNILPDYKIGGREREEREREREGGRDCYDSIPFSYIDLGLGS